MEDIKKFIQSMEDKVSVEKQREIIEDQQKIVEDQTQRILKMMEDNEKK